MNSIAKLSSEDRKYVFLKTSESLGKSTSIVEKDYWICYILYYLFTESDYKNMLVFKGGTSLSKGFGLINRMSEDIDLILNWRLLGKEYDIESWEKDDSISKNKINKNKKSILIKTNEYLKNVFTPMLAEGLKKDLGYEVGVSCVDEESGMNIYVDYPKTTKDTYLLDVIKLEIGPLAALTPTKMVDIVPDCYNEFHQLFKTSSAKVNTVIPERSFWEKATILHREAFRPSFKPMPIRYFRHYYDLYMLGKSKYKALAIMNIDLLRDVIHFKEKFYQETWMNYESIMLNGIKLIPEEYRLIELKEDYRKMKEMIMFLIPFEEIMNELKTLENEINYVIFNSEIQN